MKSSNSKFGGTQTIITSDYFGSANRIDDTGSRSLAVFEQGSGKPYVDRPLRYYSDMKTFFNGTYYMYNVNGPHINSKIVGILSPLGPMDTDWLNPGDVYNACLSDIAAKVRDNDFNLPVALGQLRETARLGEDLWTLSKKFAKKLPPAKLLVAGSALLAEARLAYSYAVKPTLADIVALVELQPRKSYTLRFKVKRQVKQSEVLLNQRVPHHTPYVGRKDIQQVVGHKFALRVDVRNPVTDLAERLNAWNLGLLGWELVPFSFLIDGIVDIGSTLDLLGAAVTMNQNYTFSGTHTAFRRRTVVCTVDTKYFEWPYMYTENSKASIKETHVDRKIIAAFPTPTLPTLSVPTGSGFLLNTAALMRTVLLGHHK